MKRLLTILALILLTAGFSFEALAVDAFDASRAGEYAVSAEAVEAESASQDEAAASIFLFTDSIRSAASEFLHRELGINTVHGQPLPGVLISLLLGAAFGLARKLRNRRAAQTEQQAENAFILTARLLRMQILYLYPPNTIHTISPGPDLFCQRE
ncbi:MAG: hypothetical protein IJT68_00200 [Lentisphaeria bacterium]|nr:hypothetical protein [Lentisphaeria bacterium]MBR3505745.1 hypothetical protein [Lentisphaeria bacterium]